MELGELISLPSLMNQDEFECPFKDEPVPAESLDHQDDPSEDHKADELQKNDGGKLGTNLKNGQKGKADSGKYLPTDYLHTETADDTKRGEGNPKIRVPAHAGYDVGDFPYTCGAHHLIPGNASLKKAKMLVKALSDGGEVKSTDGRTLKVEGHSGYDVNGSHNGAWLPSHYAIKTALAERTITRKGKSINLPARASTTPEAGVPWSKLPDPWRFAYMAGACKSGGGMFHDTHKNYSNAVLLNLNKITLAVAHHLTICPLCQEKNGKEKNGGDKVPPPFLLKLRLYATSQRLRSALRGGPGGWRRTWWTSDYWRPMVFKAGKVSDEFDAAYSAAQRVES